MREHRRNDPIRGENPSQREAIKTSAREATKPKRLELPEILVTDHTSDITISPEKSKQFIESLLHPVRNSKRERTLKKIEEFFKDKKLPIKITISDLDRF